VRVGVAVWVGVPGWEVAVRLGVGVRVGVPVGAPGVWPIGVVTGVEVVVAIIVPVGVAVLVGVPGPVVASGSTVPESAGGNVAVPLAGGIIGRPPELSPACTING
jgi:hypothetical protein